MNAIIHELCKELEKEVLNIDSERKILLDRLVDYIIDKRKNKLTARLNVICTHNSRRSHIGQLWIMIASSFYGIDNIESFSGGTEATALNPRVVTALRSFGFKIESENLEIDNPVYNISWDESMKGVQAFSKVYSGSPNPTSDYGAIMVCTEADKGCPIVQGADFRLALPFLDPKAFDDTENEGQAYRDKIKEIGTEILYCIDLVAKS